MALLHRPSSKSTALELTANLAYFYLKPPVFFLFKITLCFHRAICGNEERYLSLRLAGYSLKCSPLVTLNINIQALIYASFSQLNNILEIVHSPPLILHKFLCLHNHSFIPAPYRSTACCSASSLICNFTARCPHLDCSQWLWQSNAPLQLQTLFSFTAPVKCREFYICSRVS